MAAQEDPKSAQADSGYTINYNTVSIIEYIKFASKICNANFIFNEEDLQFTITVVSDAPITPQNVMSTLLQILRIHGLTLLEQDNSLVIHKAPTVRQIGSLAFGSEGSSAPIVTRVFRLKYSNPSSVAAVIRPMISSDALLETVTETRQLILTDVTASVDKVAALIENLDAPFSQLEIRTYQPKYHEPSYLISLAHQILSPMVQGSPFILVPQTLANEIFIVSTPDLNEKAVQLLTTLDVPPKMPEGNSTAAEKRGELLVVKLEDKQGPEVLQSLKEIALHLKQSGAEDRGLTEAIETAKWNAETNTLRFVGSAATNAKVKEYIDSLPPKGGTMMAIKLDHTQGPEVLKNLKEITTHLKESGSEDRALTQAVENAKWNPETNTLRFVATPATNAKIKEYIESLPTKGGNLMFIKLDRAHGTSVLKSLREIATHLKETGSEDRNLMDAINNAKWNAETNTLRFIGSPETNAKIKDYIHGLPSKEGHLMVVKLDQRKGPDVLQNLKEIATHFKESGSEDHALTEAVQNAKWDPETNTLRFVGSSAANSKIKGYIDAIPSKGGELMVIKLDNRQGSDVLQRLREIATHLKDSGAEERGLLDAINNAKWAQDTNTLMFVGSPQVNAKLKDYLATIPSKERASFFLHTPIYRSPEELEQSIKEIADNLTKSGGAPASFIADLRSVTINPKTHALMFSGDPASFPRIQELLAKADVPPGGEATMSCAPGKTNYAVYKVQSADPNDLQNALEVFAANLHKAKVNPSLVQTIEGMKYINQTHSLLFTGPDDCLKKAQELAQQFDTGAQTAVGSSQFLVYKPKYQTGDEIVRAMKDLRENLSNADLKDPLLIRSLDSMKWVKQTNSLLFTGDPTSLKRVEQLLATVDTGSGQKPAPRTSYSIYKVQNTTGDLVEEDLETLSKNMRAAGMKEVPLVHVLDNVRYVKETNSLLLTGDPDAIKEAEALIAKYDYPRKAAAGPGNFFMYKPQNQSASAIEKALKDVSSNLQQSSLADPSLLSAIASMKYVESTNSLIFTGTPDAIQKIQGLLKEIDIPQQHAPIQHIGKTTFLLYKLQHASPTQITTSVKAISNDLKKSGAADKEFITALSTMKYVKETNSLMFTGTEDALVKVQHLVEKFDVASLAPAHLATPSAPVPHGPLPSNFFIYKPVALSPEDLAKTLNDFADNLKMSGLNDPGLFQAIESMRFVNSGPSSAKQSIVFTGDTKTLDRVKELLKEFDIPSGMPVASSEQIQAIDNTSFMVYKLQFHRGDEIQNALRQIGKDLTASNAAVNQTLLNAIQSVQWLEVTNSLLCSGDPETLLRLRELIKSLDLPLKQVFIEMLILQTSLTNGTDFGLEWGGKVKYKDKFSGSFNNLLPTDTVAPGTFSSNLQNVNPPGNPPVPTDIPFSSGFDVGVIGDIITHKGQSFLSLGSLLNAIQTDAETIAVLTPKLIAQDGKSASIFVGQNVPFAGSFISNQSSNTINTSNLEYRNIGFNLTITPVLGNSNIVTLDLSIDNSSTSSSPGTGATFTFQAGQASGITTNQATLQTTVHVPDKHFVILSGMVNNSNAKQTASIPCLGAIPYLGAAFTQNYLTDSLNSLVIFIRPTILNSVDEMQQLTADQEEFFRESAGTARLERHFDEAMDTIKTADDE